MTDTAWCYHGKRTPDGTQVLVHGLGRAIPGGVYRAALPHVVRHSPTGFDWGYGGSGAADLARSLLIHALGRDALCRTCLGTRKVIWSDADTPAPWPFHPCLAADVDRELIGTCPDCDDGHRADLPYQAFKEEHVAGWGDMWRIGRPEILEWVADREDQEATA